MKEDKLSINLKALYFSAFGALGCFFPFLTYYFQEKGLSYTEIGIAYAIFSITGVLTQPIWGFITDKYLNKRMTIIITMILSSIVVYNFTFAKSFYYILFSIIMFLIFQSSIIPVTDAYCYEIIEDNQHIQYGRIRLMGSLGYAVTALLGGLVIKKLGINSGFFLYSFVILIGVIQVYKLNFRGNTSKSKVVTLKEVTNLLKDKRFLFLMISVLITSISFGSNNSYISLLIQATGGDVSILGLLGFTLAISELPTLFFGKNLLKKYGELNIFNLGVLLFVIRYFLSSICTSYIWVIIIQGMQGITFSLFLIASLQYLNKITPTRIRTSAMTFYTAVCGIGAFVGNIGGGTLLESISIFSLYRVLALICLVSTMVIVILKNIDKKHQNELSVKLKSNLQYTVEH